ncbi:ATP synthase subunit I [Geobacter pelophilus]|jgi:hypothetical protein|uniref:ATP synthase subunit I n=1 Tax=Geoanaerobacter pelophilus TaxID=60036 RepID=A0AAW4L941_9BACT|nr:ATP synthase subunit I [Geoanaerobacter pelophilus]MBT0664836.1 ATP synthase subunit I [Geoanaerobacter pelophilus]
MGTARINDDNLITVLVIGCACLVVIMSITGWLMGSGRFAIGIATGGCLALLNFFWLRVALQKILQMPAGQATRSANVRYILRLSALGFILWALIVKAQISIPGLLVGLSVLVIGIVLMTIYRLLHLGG